ncbi:MULTISPECIES: 2-keto-4-pentenoate hydratase [unclassified Nocardioides]|uniref:2-keto-4-pentenoate hydratase n=1 Tax=unclassified Nocardioides TaxID=2615069 RepID=UPI000AEC0862|nr:MULTISPECIES: fumarylacetoacetate hydrolase family protein [unclassified Nocardioides]
MTSIVSAGTTLLEAQRRRKSHLHDRWLAGESVVGVKASLTSAAAQARLGAPHVQWGWLTDAMELENGAVVTAQTRRVTRVEAELAFVLGADLVGPGVTRRDVLAATRAVLPALELPSWNVDERPTTLDRLISTNASADRFVVGQPCHNFADLDLSLLGVLLEINGEVAGSAAGAAAMGDPAQAVAELVNALARDEQGELNEGTIVLTGALLPPIDLQPGMSITATFAHLGSVEVTCRGAGEW